MPATVRILIAGALFATGGALIKSCEFPSLQRAAVRALAAAITIFLLMPEARRWPNRRVLALIPAYFVATCCFVVANSLTTAANAIFLQSTAPLWVLLLSPMLLGERARPRDLVVLLGIAAGMTCCFLAPSEVLITAPNPRLGDALALLAGVGFAFLLIGMRRLARETDSGNGKHASSAAVAAWGSLATCPLSLALMPLVDQAPTLGRAEDWLIMSSLGVVQIGIAYVVLVRAMPHVPVVRTSLLLMIEPALSPLIALAVHDERPHALTFVGGALIVGSVAVGSLVRRPR